MGVADAAAPGDVGAHRVGQQALGDRRRGIAGVEGQRDVDLAVAEQLAVGRVVGREGLAAAPQQRVELVEPGPERRRFGGEAGVGRRQQQQLGIPGKGVERLLQEGVADEVRRRRVGEAAGMRARPRQQVGDPARRIGKTRLVVEQDELGLAPGRFETLDRHGEVERHGGVGRWIEVARVRQQLGEGSGKQALGLHRREVFAIDPDQVDRALVLLAGGLLGQHAGHRLGGVGELHMAQRDAPSRYRR